MLFRLKHGTSVIKLKNLYNIIIINEGLSVC
ncbi:hypothetical protein IX317_000840 [Fusobacterium sp. DD29]|nr:hypothetical protein [Fusobacterium sp. DD45]MBR8710702.1 hypothetical protein [Fusobacterium sp. DD28]MBR8749177.1 hypothetical protein [Fusobacterium sp. DD29]MBR8751250.1 hypothetical protein [Fusobacterium sp. DD26]MBR8761443.1 hypothetical protein [Fusobacterium sp. DD25]MBR8767456.1 hypothetical protein [Fusobacterium sp. DD43]MBR8771483.1 hypothetical protein [Fusobacterium sp. DD40]MBR8775709.1 hypothetical protein [Fusobacterium sp. DD17]MBR8797971.1 hypothetical protein [Fusoba